MHGATLGSDSPYQFYEDSQWSMSADNNELIDRQLGSRRTEVVNIPTSYATYDDH